MLTLPLWHVTLPTENGLRLLTCLAQSGSRGSTMTLCLRMSFVSSLVGSMTCSGLLMAFALLLLVMARASLSSAPSLQECNYQAPDENRQRRSGDNSYAN